MLAALMQKLLTLQPQQRTVLSPAEITALFRKGISNNKVRIRTCRTNVADTDQILVGGLYDEYDDREGLPCIEIGLYFNQDVQHIDTSCIDWYRLCFDVAETFGHELVHRDQAHRSRKTKRKYAGRGVKNQINEEQEYLGNPDEIEAYGFSIAAEMMVIHGVTDIDDPDVQSIVMYSTYQLAFGQDQSVLLKLRKQILKYLHRLEVENNVQTNKNRRARRT